MTNNRPTILIDFDGCVHSYENGWQEGRIYGTVVPGFFEWAAQAKKNFTLAIFSSRSDSHKNIKPMVDWLTVHLKNWHWDREDQGKEPIELTMYDFHFPMKKPPSWVIIDDRAITFTGDWNAAKLTPETISSFKSWVQTQGTKLPAVK